jgi:hypothetical protein
MACRSPPPSFDFALAPSKSNGGISREENQFENEYPDVYSQDHFCEVDDSVADVLESSADYDTPRTSSVPTIE